MALACDGPRLRPPVGTVIEQFLTTRVRPDATLHAAWATLTNRTDGERQFDAGGLWTLDRHDGRPVFRFFSPLIGPGPYRQASFAPDFSTGEVLIHRPYFRNAAAVYPLEYPLDELLLIHLLAASGGVEVHACGLRDSSGAGYLFVGQSGAGKSTIAGLWRGQPGVTLLSDDRIVVRASDAGVRMYGTPWHGDAALASPERADLTAVCFLTPADHLALTPVAKGQAAARLFACCFPPFYDPTALAAIAATLDRLVHQVPCLELSFTPTLSVIEFVRRQLA